MQYPWKQVFRTSLAVASAVLFLAVPAQAGPGQGKGGPPPHAGKGADKASGPESSTAGDAATVAEKLLRLGDREERIIREWFGNEKNLEGLPPGLAKRESLPPGLEKQLQRNGQLPPGLEKKLHPLPNDLARRLPRLPDGHRRVILGNDVIVLNEKTSAIVDILRGVVTLGRNM